MISYQFMYNYLDRKERKNKKILKYFFYENAIRACRKYKIILSEYSKNF